MDEEVRKQLKPWEQELLRILNEVHEKKGDLVRSKKKGKNFDLKSSSVSVRCSQHKGLHVESDSRLFRKCPICARDRIIEEYAAAVSTLYDLRGLDLQFMQVIFDTYDNSGTREERNRRRDEIISELNKLDNEVKSRLDSIRDCYAETLQTDPLKS
ncbi:MAG: hypothetical protein M1368_02890 [Thaumarchaeota archaeon]|nr:hypothetical protein [Nitrososphaerota archaeon]